MSRGGRGKAGSSQGFASSEVGKVALVHDWLTGLRGGEYCLLNFLKMYPDADIFALLHVPGSTTASIDGTQPVCCFH